MIGDLNDFDNKVLDLNSNIPKSKVLDILKGQDGPLKNEYTLSSVAEKIVKEERFTNWYNSKTGNSGIIKITKSYLEGPFKCKDYDSTIDISNSWPLIGIGGQNRKVVFGTACQTPDGKWFEKR